MKKIITSILLLVSLFLFTSLDSPRDGIIHIVPLGDVSIELINTLDRSIEDYYGVTCVVSDRVDTNTNILSSSKEKYDANKILLEYLSASKRRLVVTNIGIVNEKDSRYGEWEIYGISYRPGPTAVISTAMLDDDGCSKDTFVERTIKIGLHEIAHNIGMKGHCYSGDDRCFMNDASDGLEELDKEEIWMCNDCEEKLK